MEQALTSEEIDRFITTGFVRLEQAFDPKLAAIGRQLLWRDMNLDAKDPQTWNKPVVRLMPTDSEPFCTAANNARLHTAFDQLVGTDRWFKRPNLGLFVIRFPHKSEPDDTGWHIDGSYSREDIYYVNIYSRERALLMLFLLSDIGTDDAPTKIRIGSHLDIPLLLLPAGEQGMSFSEISALAGSASEKRAIALATGRAGDVYLCHPFLVHAAQRHRGLAPRFMAQPPLTSKMPYELERSDKGYSPVEVAIRLGLDQYQYRER